MSTFFTRFFAKRGFTLVESLVAVALIMVALVGPFRAAETALVAAQDSKNRLIGVFLAQEGLEYVRMLRDNTYLQDYNNNVDDLSNTAFYNNFLGGESGTVYSVFGCLTFSGSGVGSGPGGNGNRACALDTADTALGFGVGPGKKMQVCTNLDCADKPLYLTNGQYSISGTGTSLFRRSVRFYEFGDGVEAVVEVNWTYHSLPRSIRLSSYLLPWE